MFTATWSADRRSAQHQAGASVHWARLTWWGQGGGALGLRSQILAHSSSTGPGWTPLVCDLHWAQLGPLALSAGSPLCAPGPSLSLQALRVMVPQRLGQSTCQPCPHHQATLLTTVELDRAGQLDSEAQSQPPRGCSRTWPPHPGLRGPESEPPVGLHLDPPAQVLSPPRPTPLGP